jgi:uncharacterized protein YukE
MSISLEYGELRDAATTVSDGIQPLSDLLTELSDSVGTASDGFQGQAASGLGEALTAWFQVAQTLGPIMEAYASALMTVANEHITNEGGTVTSYQRLTERLGGGTLLGGGQ